MSPEGLVQLAAPSAALARPFEHLASLPRARRAPGSPRRGGRCPRGARSRRSTKANVSHLVRTQIMASGPVPLTFLNSAASSNNCSAAKPEARSLHETETWDASEKNARRGDERYYKEETDRSVKRSSKKITCINLSLTTI